MIGGAESKGSIYEDKTLQGRTRLGGKMWRKGKEVEGKEGKEVEAG